MSWTDSWAFNEEGVLVRTTSKDEGHGQRFGGSALSRIHDLQDEEEAGASAAASGCPPSPAALGRSKSVGSAPAAASVNAPQRKSGLGVLKWLKKAFNKLKK